VPLIVIAPPFPASPVPVLEYVLMIPVLIFPVLFSATAPPFLPMPSVKLSMRPVPTPAPEILIFRPAAEIEKAMNNPAASSGVSNSKEI